MIEIRERNNADRTLYYVYENDEILDYFSNMEAAEEFINRYDPSRLAAEKAADEARFQAGLAEYRREWDARFEGRCAFMETQRRLDRQHYDEVGRYDNM